MKLLRIPTTGSFLRSLSAAAAALLISMSSARAATNYSATILADGPVAYYQLQELPGATTAMDSSSNALDASYNFNSIESPTLGEPGIDTNSILFTFGTGPSDYGDVSLPASLLLAPVQSDGVSGAPFSAEAWVEATTFTNEDYIVPLAMSGAYAEARMPTVRDGIFINQKPRRGPGRYSCAPPPPSISLEMARTWFWVFRPISR